MTREEHHDGSHQPSSSPDSEARFRLRLDVLSRISRHVLHPVPLTSIAEELCKLVCPATATDACVVRILDDTDLVLLAEWGAPQVRANVRFPASQGLAAEILKSCKAVAVNDVTVDPRTSEFHRQCLSTQGEFVFLSFAGVPMMVNDKPVGILAVYSVDSFREFTDTDLDYLQALANQVAVALVNHRLYAELEKANRRLSEEASRRERASRQLTHTATHDGLTGLPNRIHFLQLLRRRLSLSGNGHGSGFGVLLMDVDQLRRVNDALGHAAGDDVLKHAAFRARATLKPSDVISRVGSDEFAIMYESGPGDNRTHEFTTMLRDRLSAPIQLGSHQVAVTVSMGAAQHAPHYDNPETLLRDAETALYHAKSAGRGAIRVFESGMHDEASRLLSLESDLRQAIETGQLFPYYQPIVRASDRTVGGYEALARWLHPIRGLVPPDQFLHLAEDHRLIQRLGEHILEKACAAGVAAISSETGRAASVFRPPWISVNVSGRQLDEPDFARRVANTLDTTGLPPQRLNLEITETVLMERHGGALDQLREIRSTGVGISIDDFGTGYSSLGLLSRLPLTTVKIDRSFIAQMFEPQTRPIVPAIIALAHSLGLRVVAEGVETEQTAAELNSLGCDYLQGFLFGRAAPMASSDADASTT